MADMWWVDEPWWKHNPDPPVIPGVEGVERMYVVNPFTCCWEWQGTRTPTGYGRMRVGKHWEPAHRVFYEAYWGVRVPAGLHMDHLCRNRGCVNPEHLEPVTTRREHAPWLPRRPPGTAQPLTRRRSDQGFQGQIPKRLTRVSFVTRHPRKPRSGAYGRLLHELLTFGVVYPTLTCESPGQGIHDQRAGYTARRAVTGPPIGYATCHVACHGERREMPTSNSEARKRAEERAAKIIEGTYTPAEVRKFEGIDEPRPSLIARLRERFERFRAGAGHTVLGRCRCGVPGCPNGGPGPGR